MKHGKLIEYLAKSSYIYIKHDGMYTVGTFDDEKQQWSKPLKEISEEHLASLLLLYTRSEELYVVKKENTSLNKLVKDKHLTLIQHIKIWFKNRKKK